MSDRVRYLGHATVLMEIANHRILTDPSSPSACCSSVAWPRAADAPERRPRCSSRTPTRTTSIAPSMAPAPRPAGHRARRPRRVGPPLGVRHGHRAGGRSGDRVGRVTVRLCRPSIPASAAVRPERGGDRVPRYRRRAHRVLRGRYRSLRRRWTTSRERGIDVALLPVWGWGPRLGPGHLDPERAAEAVARLRPAVAIPIHWGTLWPMAMRWRRHRLSEPPIQLADAVRRRDLPAPSRDPPAGGRAGPARAGPGAA